MESIYTELALYGSKNECVRTDNVFSPMSEVCDGTVSLTTCNMLERCLKTGLHEIYQEKYITFEQILKLANMKSLKTRRVELISSFSKKAFRHDKFKGWFSESEARTVGARTRGKPIPRLKPVPCKTQRYQRSSIPLMTKLLSWHPPLRYFGLDLA